VEKGKDLKSEIEAAQDTVRQSGRNLASRRGQELQSSETAQEAGLTDDDIRELKSRVNDGEYAKTVLRALGRGSITSANQ
jgi:hypothetical protein